MKTFMKNFANDESGATAIEYGLIAVGVALAVYAGAKTLGTSLKDMFGRMGGVMDKVKPTL
jgi:pilus assembly protein Flp/PilA